MKRSASEPGRSKAERKCSRSDLVEYAFTTQEKIEIKSGDKLLSEAVSIFLLLIPTCDVCTPYSRSTSI